MSAYEQLAQTADDVRVAAIAADLSMRGFEYKDGQILHPDPNIPADQVQLVM